jgi:coiled-coil domain-containing protein 55
LQLGTVLLPVILVKKVETNVFTMNISLSAAAEKQAKQKKAKLSFGLNDVKATSKEANVFGDDDDDNDSEGEELTGRDQVNRALLREQDALRRRAAQSTAAEQADYNYDLNATYDETTKGKAVLQEDERKKKESRYISDMMKKAAKRNYELELAHERKLARELADQEGEFAGKEKFITSAYKLKLAERELWKQEEQEQQQRDEREDVTKNKNGIVGFYSNFNKHFSLGGQDEKKKDHGSQGEDDNSQSRRGFLKGFTAATADSDEASKMDNGKKPSFLDGFEASISITDKPKHQKKGDEMGITPTKSLRQLRDEKIAKARLRYFQRRGISEQEALQERY